MRSFVLNMAAWVAAWGSGDVARGTWEAWRNGEYAVFIVGAVIFALLCWAAEACFKRYFCGAAMKALGR